MIFVISLLVWHAREEDLTRRIKIMILFNRNYKNENCSFSCV